MAISILATPIINGIAVTASSTTITTSSSYLFVALPASASQLGVVPAGTLTSTNVQAALEELDGDFLTTAEVNTLADNRIAAASVFDMSDVASGTLVSGLNADKLDGQEGTYYATSSALTATTTTADAALPRTGGALEGAVTTNSTFDGVDIAVRDGVLTTTTTTANAALPRTGGNLTGAVTVDAGVTIDGVDISTRDGVLTTTTTTANAALPTIGGHLTGPLTTDSTIDGVDIALLVGYAQAAVTLAVAALPKTGGALEGAVTTNSTFDGVDIAVRDGVLTNTTTTANTAHGWGDHSTYSYATETYVGTAVSNLVDSSPATLNTLNELAAALGDDPNFATTVATSIGTKLNSSAVSAYGLDLIDDANAAAARTTLELGTAATTASSDYATSSQVLTNVPTNALFTDNNTEYSVGDGGLTQKNFTTTLNTKLTGIEELADVTDTVNVVAALTAGTNVAIAANGTISSTDFLGSANSFTGLNTFTGGLKSEGAGTDSVRLGLDAGSSLQEQSAIAVGKEAGKTRQGVSSVAIGASAGEADQDEKAVAIGVQAGKSSQGLHSIAIGNSAGKTGQGDNGIIISATGSELNDETDGHIHIASDVASLDYTVAAGWSMDAPLGGVVISTSENTAGEFIKLGAMDTYNGYMRHPIRVVSGGGANNTAGAVGPVAELWGGNNNASYKRLTTSLYGVDIQGKLIVDPTAVSSLLSVNGYVSFDQTSLFACEKFPAASVSIGTPVGSGFTQSVFDTVEGVSYIITVLGDTNWSALYDASTTPVVGLEFTANATAATSTTGNAGTARREAGAVGIQSYTSSTGESCGSLAIRQDLAPAFVVGSDVRLKENIVTVDPAESMALIEAVRVVDFDKYEHIWNRETTAPIATNVRGVIAQEIRDPFPGSVIQMAPDDPTGLLSVTHSNHQWDLLNAVKFLKAEVDALKAETVLLRAEVTALSGD